MEQKQSNKRLSPKGQKERVEVVKYLLLVEGISIKETAARLHLNPKTISLLVKHHKLKEQLKKVDVRQLGDSLAAFIAYVRIHQKDLYQQIAPAYEQFLNTF